MKQRITDEQLDELSDEQKNRLREWWLGSNPRLSDLYVVLVQYDDLTRYEGPYVNSGHRDFLKDYYTGEALPLLSIGQMVALLQSSNTDWTLMGSEWDEPDICDRLWEVAKRVL